MIKMTLDRFNRQALTLSAGSPFSVLRIAPEG
jgi:hypothetical protein